MKHELKTLPEFFQVAWVGNKSFEIRNNDRHFNVWDEIVLQEFDNMQGFHTGREIEGIITYITNFKQEKGYIVFGYEITGKSE